MFSHPQKTKKPKKAPTNKYISKNKMINEHMLIHYHHHFKLYPALLGSVRKKAPSTLGKALWCFWYSHVVPHQFMQTIAIVQPRSYWGVNWRDETALSVHKRAWCAANRSNTRISPFQLAELLAACPLLCVQLQASRLLRPKSRSECQVLWTCDEALCSQDCRLALLWPI